MDERITKVVGKNKWILIGGPPCQAYSLIGRSINRGKDGYRLEDDEKSILYLEYSRKADFMCSRSSKSDLGQAWKQDYEWMQTAMFLDEPPSFEQILNCIKGFEMSSTGDSRNLWF